jgi:pyrroloquinoline quinone biosynthesis protein B
VIVRILGSAAGGGYPQWNCYCPVCTVARNDPENALPRTQSSIAFRADDGPWYLVNASPDLRQQLAEFPFDPGGDLRATPFAGILLTDAEIDHTAGLLLMRESSVPLHIYSTDSVRQALTDGYPVFPMLERYCGMTWTELGETETARLSSGIEIESFPTGGDPPLYLGGDADGPSSVGLTIRDVASGGVLTYAPALEAIDEAMLKRFEESDHLAIDGTFWTGAELVELGLAQRDALAMGHLPLSGPDGSLERLDGLAPKTVLVHINNTNPILLADSAERALLDSRGITVARDGMELSI